MAHVGYLPATGSSACRSSPALVDFFARRAQIQERLTKQVADHLQTHLAPRGVGVVIEAEHTCMTLRGARADGARTVTSALFGRCVRTPPPAPSSSR